MADVVGPIANPWASLNPGYGSDTRGGGLIILFNNLLKTTIVIGGVWAFINLIIAGYGFIAAGGNPEKITLAWNKIWQSLVGLLIVAGSFALAAIFGFLVFNDATAILSPTIYGPGP